MNPQLDFAPFREAIAEPEKLTVSQWAERSRVLGAGVSEPGGWRNSRTPYLVEIMNSCNARHVRRTSIMSSTQVGKTECLLNCIGWIVGNDPAPTILVMPREEDCQYVMVNRIQPMVEKSLRDHLTPRSWDVTMSEIRFDHMTLYTAGGNSPAGLASKAIRNLFIDELDKLPPFAGKEADPVSLAVERTRTFPDRRIICCSTPTTRGGLIWAAWQLSDKREFHVPCPHCHRPQVLAFANIRFGEERDGAAVRERKLAHYYCSSCGAEIRDTDKPRMLTRGVWVPEGGHVLPGGKVSGDLDKEHRGYHLSALYSPWLTWSEIAGEWLDSQGDVGKLMNFHNAWLGMPWEERIEDLRPERMTGLEDLHEVGHVPAEAVVLTAGVDVQVDEMFYVVRAWGAEAQSWLVKAGRVPGWDQIVAELVEGSWDGHQVQLVNIDSGYRTEEVYEFCRGYPDVTRPCKGQDKLDGVPFSSSKIERNPVTGNSLPSDLGTLLWHINTGWFKDRLVRYIYGTDGKGPRWRVHKDVSPEYLRHISAEHKVMVREGKQVRPRWLKKQSHGANHWLDAEILAMASAHMVGVFDQRIREGFADKAPKPQPMPVPEMFEPAKRSGGPGWLGGGQRGRGGKGWLR